MRAAHFPDSQRQRTAKHPFMTSIAKPIAALPAFLHALRTDYLFWTLLLVLAALTVAAPAGVARYPGLVDWPTMATLTGLLMLTKGVEESGFLHRVGVQLIARMHSVRTLALLLVSATAVLATILTNDVALFVVVPLTLTLRGVAGKGSGRAKSDGLPITRLIIFEALAANAGSALTPIGNPQNLILWQQSHASFVAFTLAMLPLAAILLGVLLLATACLFGPHPVPAADTTVKRPVDRTMLLACLSLYLPFLVLTDMHHALAAVAGLLAIFVVAYRQVLARVDWALLLVFMLMFIDLRLVAAAGPIHALLGSIDLGQARNLYLAAIAASQVISNVPATILLAQYSNDWRILAHGANVGGAGLAIGSLANIIALRMAPERRAWLVFHAYSIPFLLITGALAWAWLAWR